MNRFDKKWVAIIVLIVLLASVIIFVKNSHPVTNTETITTQLSSIQTQLNSLKLNLQKPTEKLDLSPINQDMNKLAVLVEQLKSKDESQINQLLTENHSELNQKLDAMHQVISKLDTKHKPVKYLPESVLPFKVISIDSIQQVSVATVSYNFNTIPLEKTDTLAGWTLLQVDYGKQHMELENSNKEHVRVSLGDHHE